jgi:putative ATPase
MRAAATRAQEMLDHHGRSTVPFLDEIHRLNKSQQDALLPHVEVGRLTLIGATTENPSFEVNSALLSRAQVYVLKPFSDEEPHQLLREPALCSERWRLKSPRWNSIVGFADGDGRKFLNLLEQPANAALAAGVTRIDNRFVRNASATTIRRFDKGGEAFYDQFRRL